MFKAAANVSGELYRLLLKDARKFHAPITMACFITVYPSGAVKVERIDRT